MSQVRERILRIAASHVPILIHGETGTGKELCAAAIAAASGADPFVAVNCAAFAEGIVDSELFGHERGAFTGADRAHPGLIASANGGALFLDELAEIGPAVQVKLLRTLESGEYRPVGSARVLNSRFRIIAATNGDLDALVASGRLRADLMHRLGALRIALPALRDRMEDLPQLAEEFLRRYRAAAAGGPIGLTSRALRLLVEQEWPGNVRQLRNVIDAAAALTPPGREITASRVGEVLSSHANSEPDECHLTLAEAIEREERRVLRDALRRAANNRKKAARLLDISEATLYRKLSRHFDGSDPSYNQ